jgi:hypothetical protein
MLALKSVSPWRILTGGDPISEIRNTSADILLMPAGKKINRAEANDKSARPRILLGNIEILEPLILEMYKRGKLNFLKELFKEIPNG